jgi:hypothetical protein
LYIIKKRLLKRKLEHKLQDLKTMKNLLIFLLLVFISTNSRSQVVIDSLNGIIYLKNVHEIDLTKTELKTKANEWVAKAYNNSNFVTRINSDDNILTKGSFKVGADFTAYGATIYSDLKIDYTLDLKFKNGRYKIEIIDLQNSEGNNTLDLSIYFMSPEEYKEKSIKYLENYDGIGKNAALKRINNKKKFMKDYNSTHDYGKKIIPQIVNKLKSMDASLFAYMKSKADNDNW